MIDETRRKGRPDPSEALVARDVAASSRIEGASVYLLRDVTVKGRLVPRGTHGYVAEAYQRSAALDLLLPDPSLVGDVRICNVQVENSGFAEE